VLNQLDDIAADIAATTVEDLFLGVDREPVVATAFRAWADEFSDPLPRELDAAPINFAFDRRGAGPYYPIFKLSVAAHDTG